LVDLEGLIFKSAQFGYCKVVLHLNRQVHVKFCGNGRQAVYTLDALLQGKDFKWEPLPVGTICKVQGRGECRIIQSPFGPDDTSRTHEYKVEFESEGRESATLNERELWPIAAKLIETPQTRLLSLQLDQWEHFRARDDLLRALARLHKETAGIRAIAASRIELLPHQVSVVGTVIDDPRWRYILADEVGLGKTIEAGVITHELLAENPNARVLILTPGTLSRQWLSEMHLSFGGREFKLCDLHDSRLVDWPRWTRVICSVKLATQVHGEKILSNKWDLVIVDEAHHLLWNELQYTFVKALSIHAGGILLLSAIPARERAEELLRLLQIIDPKMYADGTGVAVRFEELYREQPLIGRRLRILQSRTGKSTSKPIELQDAARRLLEVPILKSDPALQLTLQNLFLETDKDAIDQQCLSLITEVASRYRISRRILKNRRSQLLDRDLLVGVERRLTEVTYEPSPFEKGAHETLLLLLNRLYETGASKDALQILFRKSISSLCDPVALMEVAKALCDAATTQHSSQVDLDPSTTLDYDEHERMLEEASAVLAPHLDKELGEQLLTYAAAWLEKEPVPTRVIQLGNILEDLLRTGSQKLLVFAGTIGAAELVTEQLKLKFGKESVADFRHDIDDTAKETQVNRFRQEPLCRILVCDESGGEGRNFQFASVLVHFDLPWSVAAIEQRIGRLDRIGRRENVLSVTLTALGSVESAWLRCLADGFEVFRRSISGLEFLLRETEYRVIEHLMRHGPNEIGGMIEDVLAISNKERASDDSDALTDLVSFDRARRVPVGMDNFADARVEESFPRFMRTLGVSGAARRVTDKRDLSLRIWCLCPEDITRVQLDGMHRDTSGRLGDRYGTFLRQIARERPDLEFFATGHGLFENVCAIANSHLTGRTFAIELKHASVSYGKYLLTTWKLDPGSTKVDGKRLGRAKRHFYGRRIRILIDIQTGELVDQVSVRNLESQLFSQGVRIRDLRETAVSSIGMDPQTWSNLATKLIQVAREHVSIENRQIFLGEDQEFVDLTRREIMRLQQLSREESIDSIEVLEACCSAIQSPLFELDSIGVVQIEEAKNVAPSVH